MEQLPLDPEQVCTLRLLLDIVRRAPPGERAPIRLVGFDGMDQMLAVHPGASRTDPPLVYPGDVDTLAEAGLVRVSGHGDYNRTVEITPVGRAYADQHSASVAKPVPRGIHAAREYLAADAFERAYPGAYAKWLQAEELLWQDESAAHLSTVGHLCRKAMQVFADALARSFPIEVPADLAKTVARMKAVLAELKVGDAQSAVLDAQLVYWGTVSDLVQRQEHGAAKEGERLRHEDARRVVLHTLLVMYEWHRSVGDAGARRAAT